MYIFDPEEDIYKPYADTSGCDPDDSNEGDNDMWVGYIHYHRNGPHDRMMEHDGCIQVCADDKAVLMHRMTVIQKALNKPGLLKDG